MGNWDWESIKGFLPIIMIFFVGGLIIFFTNRPSKHKPENDEKRAKTNS
jgi:hypothetical protein